MLFDTYLFADYSGARARAGQRTAIRLAHADDSQSPVILAARLTRDELVEEFLRHLRDATRRGKRVCFGQDHQYGIPIALGRELGVAHLPWREALEVLCAGTYGATAPGFGHASTFACALNKWLESQGRHLYFFSATKSSLYKIPARNPRGADPSLYRLTERCRPSSNAGTPKPFNRVGDNGTVGGQSLVGMVALRQLVSTCVRESILVVVWPFDGLSIVDPAYSNAHVLLEPYPTAVREAHVPQTDSADALASAAGVQSADHAGLLEQLLDLSALTPLQSSFVRFEGWIASHVPTQEALKLVAEC